MPDVDTGAERRLWNLRILVPVAAAVTCMWIAAGVRAELTGDVAMFAIATGPFGLLCGYLFGSGIVRGKE